MKQVYTASVVGAGSGGNLSMAALAGSDRFELAAVADISPDALQAARERYPHSHLSLPSSVARTDVVCIWPPSPRGLGRLEYLKESWWKAATDTAAQGGR